MPDPTSPILVNLSFIGQRPTGLANYGLNLVKHLDLPQMILLRPEEKPLDARHSQSSVPAGMSPDAGKRGHLRRLWWTQTQLSRIYRQHRASLLFSPIPEAPLGAGCRSVVVMHDVIPLRFPNWRSPLAYYFRYYIPQVLAQSCHVICNSEATARDVREMYGISGAKITPIPLAHDAEHFRPGQPFEPSLVSANGDLPPYFLYVGRHDPYKNLHRLIAAFAALPSGVDCQLVIAGPKDSRYTPQLQAQVAESNLTGKIRFLDYVPYQQLPGLMGNAIALVFPSLWEGFGFPVLEAMACGTPVITSNCSSLPEVAGDAAILVDPLQISAITAAMQQMLVDEPGRSHLKAAGLARAREFSWQRTAARTAEVLRAQQF
jgi:glycosyltransferase involved in cell wall biosynthesis